MAPWVLALYNAYDPVRWHEAHRRALARAAPLGAAFGAHVAIVGFPIGDIARRMELEIAPRTPVEVATLVASTTTIGDDGGWIVKLAEAGKLHVLDFPHHAFPPQFGEPVLTTREPDTKKSIQLDELSERKRGNKGPFMVFGLGPRGTPPKVHAMCPRHFDVTGTGVSLETATAMGACAAAVAVASR